MNIEHNQVCVQCERMQDEVLTLKYDENEASYCQPCLINYLDGKIKFVDAHDLAD